MRKDMMIILAASSLLLASAELENARLGSDDHKAAGAAFAISHQSIHSTLAVDDSLEQEVIISNNGDQNFHFSLLTNEISAAEVKNRQIQYDFTHFRKPAKKEDDTRKGMPVVNGFGGPDNFGYIWKNSDEPNGPTYDWNDISSDGTLLSTVSGCDDCNQSQSLSFPFPFYGTEYTSIYVGSNGYITFGTPSSEYSNLPLPSTYAPANLVAAFWEDLHPGNGGSVYFKDYGDYAVVQFTNVARFSGDGTYSFQIKLHRSGTITFYYQDLSGTLISATAGIQNGTCDDGITVVYNADYLKQYHAVQLTSSPFWLTVSPEYGVIEPGLSDTLVLKMKSDDLTGGQYKASIEIQHNDSLQNSPFNLPCTMIVQGVKNIEIQPGSHIFANTWIGGKDTATFTVTNSGNEATTIDSFTCDDTAFQTLANCPLTVPAYGSTTFKAIFSPTELSTVDGLVQIHSDAHNSSILNVSLSGTGTEPPEASIIPSTLTFSIQPNAPPADQTFVLKNNGADELTYRLQSVNEAVSASFQAYKTQILPEVQKNRIYNQKNFSKPFRFDRIIVGYKDGESTPADPAILTRLKVKKTRELAAFRNPKTKKRILRGRSLKLLDLETKGRKSVLEAINTLKNDPNVAYAEPDYLLEAYQMPDDPYFANLYGLHNSGQTGGTPGADISAVEAWGKHTGNGTVTIGVIDSGIDYLHPDLVDNMWTNPDEIPNNGIDEDGNGYIDDIYGWNFVANTNDPADDNSHGTHCSGTIAGTGNNQTGVTGVMWNSKLVALKFLSGSGSGSTSDAIDAVNYASAMGIQITSNSWGGGSFSQGLMDAIAAGGLFIAAAGNSGSNNDNSPHYPASYPLDNIISVAATDHDDALASFSCYGPTTVHLGAPGVDIFSSVPNNQYGSKSGTSMAAPHVAGVAGLIWSYNPSLTTGEVKQIILDNVDPIPSLAGMTVTGGRLNAQKAIEAVGVSWLTVTPTEPGSLSPGQECAFNVTVDPQDLTAGEWRGYVILETNDPTSPLDTVVVTADVLSCKNLVSLSDSLSFGNRMIGSETEMILQLDNNCNDTVTISTIETGNNNFSSALSDPVKVPPFSSFDIPVLYTPLSEGNHSADLMISSDADDNPTITVNLSGTGTVPPDISLTPASFSKNLDAGEQEEDTLYIENTGGAVLDWSVGGTYVNQKTRNVDYGSHHFVKLEKGATDNRIGRIQPDNSGGPDQFGYRWYDSDKPNGPDFEWNDIQSSGTLLSTVSGCLDCYEALPLSFSFPFYGTEYDSIYVGSNGYITLGSGSTQYVNYPIPSSSNPANLIAGFFDDLYPATGGNIYFKDNGNEAIVQFTEVRPYSGSGYVTFQMILSPSGSITFQYKTATHNTTYCTVGIQNSTRDDGLEIAYNTSYIRDSLAVRIETMEPWLSISQSSGSVMPGETFPLPVNFNATDVEPGTHSCSIDIIHNASSQTSPISVPCTLVLEGTRHLAVSPPVYTFNNTWVNGADTATLTLSNSGNEATTVDSIITSGNNVFQVLTPAPLQVPAYDSSNIQVVFIPSGVESFSGQVEIHSNAEDFPSLSVQLSGTGTEPPVSTITPSSLTFSLQPDSPPTDQTVVISNTGGDILHYRIESVRELSSPVDPNYILESLPRVHTDIIYSQNNYQNPYVPGKVIVGLKEGMNSFSNSSILNTLHAEIKRELAVAKNPKNKTRVMGRKVYLLELKDNTSSVLDAIAVLQKDANVAYAEPDYLVKKYSMPDDSLFSELYGMDNTGQTGGTPGADISAVQAWERHTGNGSIRIGVIDTGVDYLHPDLADNIWTNPGEIPGNGIDDDGNGFIDDVHGWNFHSDTNDPMDDDSHGTHCSGTIAGSGNNGIGVAGVMWNAKLVAMKFLGPSGGSTSDAIDAVNYAAAMGIEITSNSWGGGGFSQGLMDAIASGGLFVAAAGNSGSNNDVSPHYPSNYDLDNVISVAATDHNDALAYFSCYGATSVDLGAPGVDILSSVPGGQYIEYSGTSMATPHVSGVAGLVWSMDPSLTALEVKQIILDNVDPISSLSNITVTGGRLNAQKATEAVGPQWLCASPQEPGQLQPGEEQQLTVSVNPQGLAAGEWQGQVIVSSNDPATPTDTIDVTAVIDGCRSIVADRDSLDFGAVLTGSDSTINIQLTNNCNDTTIIETIETENGSFEISAQTPLMIAPFSSVSVPVSFHPVSTGTHTSTLVFTSNAQNNPVMEITLLGDALTPPIISLSPDSFSKSLAAGETETDTLLIANSGQAALSWSINGARQNSMAEKVIYDSTHYLEQPKGFPDNRTGSAQPFNSGGPDQFGYSWIDSDDPDGPQFTWDDIQSSGTRLSSVSSCDDCSQLQTLSFSFPFYGTEYNSINVSSNGYITFGGGYSGYSNYPLPSSNMAPNLIAAFYDDLSTSYSGDIYFWDNGDSAVIQFNAVGHYSYSGTYTFQIVLSSSGAITFNYKSLTGPVTSSTTGIQNSERTDGLNIAYNTAYLRDSLSIRISQYEPWLTLSQTQGEVLPGDTAKVAVMFNAQDLTADTYSSNLDILHDSPEEISPLVVPVQLSVTDRPQYQLNIISVGGSSLPVINGSQYNLENVNIGSVTSGQAIGSRYKLFFR